MFEYLTGIYNITPTPFKPDGSLDEPSLRKLTEFTRGTRVNGMTILGVLGEADKLTESERDRVTEIVIDVAGDGLPICVGTTHAGTVSRFARWMSTIVNGIARWSRFYPLPLDGGGLGWGWPTAIRSPPPTLTLPRKG